MKALLHPDGSLSLEARGETRILRPEHPKYADLMKLYNRHATVSLSVAHAPKGYTHERPLTIGGHAFTGGQFIPGQVMADATPGEIAKLHEPAPQQSSGGYRTEEHVPPPGYGGNPWRGAYMTAPIDPDPWGNRYAVNVEFLTGGSQDVVAFSSGPDEQIDSAYSQNGLTAGDDDLMVLVEP